MRPYGVLHRAKWLRASLFSQFLLLLETFPLKPGCVFQFSRRQVMHNTGINFRTVLLSHNQANLPTKARISRSARDKLLKLSKTVLTTP